ncbi:hypothetical protein JZO81_21790 [Enterococcus hulanensis]|uniref:hypothetical protein n=1 Tax=Enterococcus TaxID=1350 RepID=UPI000B5ABAE5|nr:MULTISPECIES: hypothetical protein [Enterococcus]MBO0413697.1 hypothetical protein [Enterococcus hulanensis]OTO20814.1 hypothetical protein A5875_002167 [Enterococcus sp. 3H8_DIV0648]
MKKYGIVVGLLLVLGVISGCGGGVTPQEEYKEELQKQSKMNSGTFDLTIDSLSIDVEDNTSDPEKKMMLDVIEKQLKGVSLTGSYQKEKKTKNQYVKLQLTAFGQEIPFDFYSDHQTKDVYANAEPYNAALQLMSQFGTDIPLHSVKTKNIEGKYILMTQKEATETTGQKELPEDLSKYIDKLDKDTFKKDGDKLTHRFTKKEIQNYLSNQEEKPKDTEVEKLKSLSIDLTLDTKKHTKQGKITAKSTADDASYTIKMTMNQKPKNNDKSIQLPKKDAIIPIEDFLTEITSPVQVDDEDMTEILKNIEENKDTIDAQTAEHLKETYREHMNDEQYQQVVQALDEAVAENNK